MSIAYRHLENRDGTNFTENSLKSIEYAFAIVAIALARSIQVSLNSAQGRKPGTRRNVPARKYTLFQVRPAPWLGNPAAVWNMHWF